MITKTPRQETPADGPDPAQLQAALLHWYARHGRHDLPWKRPATPYRIWLSEIMLQQTQVRTVLPYFQRFVARFPEVAALAAAPLDEVLALWSGLGYYARARNLHACARRLMAVHQGRFPQDLDALMALPGIGRSTAGAILAQAYGLPHPILDGNVKRVLARLHAVEGWPGTAAVERRLWQLAERYTPHTRVADYTQAIMDLGALLCTRKRPRCSACPWAEHCQAHRQGRSEAFPQPRPRRPLPRRHSRWLLIEDRGRILLQRRPASGLWGGLWVPPELPDDVDDVGAWCLNRWGLAIAPPTSLPELRHTFTHFRLHVTPLHARLCTPAPEVVEPSETLWYKLSGEATIGLPRPVQALLNRLKRGHP